MKSMHNADDESTRGMIQNVDIPLDVPTLWTPAHVARAQIRIQKLQDEKRELQLKLDDTNHTSIISKSVIAWRAINNSFCRNSCSRIILFASLNDASRQIVAFMIILISIITALSLIIIGVMQ